MSKGSTCVVGPISRSTSWKNAPMRAASAVRAVTAQSWSATVSSSPASRFQMIVSLSSERCASVNAPKRRRKPSARRMWKMRLASRKSGAASTTVAPASAKVCRSAPTVSRTGRCTGSPKSSVTAMRSPARSMGSSGRNGASFGRQCGMRGSGPARTENSSAASSTLRAIGPAVERSDHGLPGHSGTRPGEGRKPTTLQNAAGLRSEPPVSLPSAIGAMCAARATAAPPLLPPQVLPRW